MDLGFVSTVLGKKRSRTPSLLASSHLKVSLVASSGTISSLPSAPRTSQHHLFAVLSILMINNDLVNPQNYSTKVEAAMEPPGGLALTGLLHLPMSGLLF